MRRTKIVCTIGPASSDENTIRNLILAGMDVARLNFSHGTVPQHIAACGRVRAAAAALGRNVAVMIDLQGPKIRTDTVAGGEIELVEGSSITITTDEVVGTASLLSTDYAPLPHEVKAGDHIFIADGLIDLVVERVAPPEVHARVVSGGRLSSHKGINLPGVAVSAPALTKKDLADLDGALSMDPDIVALSFVRGPEDIQQLRSVLDEADRTIPIVAKIERPEAVAAFDAILDVTDMVMVARGDLGIEIPLDEVPQVQKRLIRRCNDRAVPVITATQMLESMTHHPRPTRAEVADVANAIYDGTDAVMLSGETAAGAYPVPTVRIMAQIAATADESMTQSPSRDQLLRMREAYFANGKGKFGDAISQSACRLTQVIGASRIVCFTKQGYTARHIARFRPSVPITAITLTEAARRKCTLIWGVDAIISAAIEDTDDMSAAVDDILLHHKLAQPGDVVVIAAGMPFTVYNRTNMVKIHVVGTADLEGPS
jgi:pyruvate kinase